MKNCRFSLLDKQLNTYNEENLSFNAATLGPRNIYNKDLYNSHLALYINVKIIEGERQRIQSFEGNVISGKKRLNKLPKIGQNFVVRRLSYGVGVERIFPFHSPIIDSVKVLKKGKVRRAKLYYLRNLKGKAARIKSKE